MSDEAKLQRQGSLYKLKQAVQKSIPERFGGKSKSSFPCICCLLVCAAIVVLIILLAYFFTPRVPDGDVKDVKVTQFGPDGSNLVFTADVIVELNNPNYVDIKFDEVRVNIYHHETQAKLGKVKEKDLVFASQEVTEKTIYVNLSVPIISQAAAAILADYSRGYTYLDYKGEADVTFLYKTKTFSLEYNNQRTNFR